jgi:ABC-type antimicrobial peptide transport system permease subunit
VLASLLYGVVARDFITMAGSALLLAAVAFIAAAVPARRAAALQPTAALRED